MILINGFRISICPQRVSLYKSVFILGFCLLSLSLSLPPSIRLLNWLEVVLFSNNILVLLFFLSLCCSLIFCSQCSVQYDCLIFYLTIFTAACCAHVVYFIEEFGKKDDEWPARTILASLIMYTICQHLFLFFLLFFHSCVCYSLHRLTSNWFFSLCAT